jgi:hypothetical protein
MAVVVAVIALPIKVWAGISMNRQGWLTRTAAGRVQGQSEITAPAATDRSSLTTATEVRHAN